MTLWLLTACVPDGPLTDVSAWEPVDPADDPFDDAPDGAGCDPLSWGPEGQVLEIDTTTCSYLTVAQPLLRNTRRPIQIPIWNLGTWAPEPAEAHVAVWVGGTVWEATTPIPSPARSWTAELDVRGREGEPIVLHLHNHGTNSWRFGVPTDESDRP